jgi:hypothetical protein
MAHFAEVDDNNVVIRVLVTSNQEPDEGLGFLTNALGGRWLKTSYNTVGGVHLIGGTPFRGNFAGIGYTYDEALDAFLPPKPTDGEWVIDPVTFQWVAVV